MQAGDIPGPWGMHKTNGNDTQNMRQNRDKWETHVASEVPPYPPHVQSHND